ncbi:MAG: EamA family transporter [Syntrophaceticus sp.]|nr:EamA family transporter [Syntrophaceticus sp.]MDD4359058.1 EamA family transporter [Syntrophaceticus sp.]
MRINQKESGSLFRCHLSLLFVIILWGSSFASIKILLPQVPANTIALLRFIIASIGLGLFFVITKQPRLRKRDLPGILLSGISGITIFSVLQNQGLRYAGVTDAAIFIAMSPVFIALLSWVFLKEKISSLQIVGVFIAFAGSVLVATDGSFNGFGVDKIRLYGDLLVLLSSLAWAVFSITLKKLLIRYPATTIMTYSVFVGTVFLIPFSLLEYPFDLSVVNAAGWLNIIYLGLLASAMGNLIWNTALGKVSAVTAGTYLYLSPVVAAVVSLIFLNEIPTIYTIVGGLIILLGTFFASK